MPISYIAATTCRPTVQGIPWASSPQTATRTNTGDVFCRQEPTSGASTRFSGASHKGLRLLEFCNTLASSHPACTLDEALMQMIRLMEDQEKDFPPGEQMKPLRRHHFTPLPEFDGLYAGESFKHQVILAENGAILIRRIEMPRETRALIAAIKSKHRDPQHSFAFTQVLVDKPGADGHHVWEHAARVKAQNSASIASGDNPSPTSPPSS